MKVLQRLCLASGNAHKVAELAALASGSCLPVVIESARRFGGMPPVAEDTGTFEGNARRKADALRTRLPADVWALADDSGVCVDALDGAPGVESAYFAGPQADPAANLRLLTERMRGVPVGMRGARFVCVLLFLDGQGGEKVFRGECAGHLLDEPRGGGGFGYDPLFVPDGHTASYAELGDEVKNGISHRARAWAQLAAWVRGRTV